MQNINRFSGFAEVYTSYRPIVPRAVIAHILLYLDRIPKVVVDIGCGPGISTFPWSKYAKQVIGIEPNQDMLNQASVNLQRNKKINNVSFQFGYSHRTGLKSGSVDIVTCSQSFHWMNPKSTLKEIARILKKGGIFATIDYDWPPSIDWIVEQEFRQFSKRVNQLHLRHTGEEREGSRWSKDQHLANIRSSNHFRFSKEIVSHHETSMNAEQFIGLVLSLGSVNRFVKECPQEIAPDFKRFKKMVMHRIQGKQKAIMSYRIRLGIK